MAQTPVRPIRLNSSAIAALIGRNPYASTSDAILTAWKSTDRDSYARAHTENGVETPEARKRRVEMAYPDIASVGRTTKPSLLQSTLRAMSTSMFLPDDIPSPAGSPITRREAMDLARETANTTHGIDRESVVLDRVNEILGTSFAPCDQVWSREIGRLPSGRPVVVQGRVDGLDPSRVLEIKTRARRLFLSMKEYERIQIDTYLFLTERTEAILAEAYFPSRAAEEPDLNMIPVTRDEDRIAEMLEDAIRTSRALDTIMQCPDAQRAFLTTRHREALVAEWSKE